METNYQELSGVALRKKSNHMNYITVLSVFSCLGVLFLHFNFVFWGFNQTSWINANAIESLFYFSAPMFFMISGATLIDYRDRYDTKTYFKKRFLKVVFPYIFWTFILLIFYTSIGRFAWKDFLLNFWEGLFFTKVESTYYFILDILMLYLAIPLLSLIPKEKRQTAYAYIIVLGLILNVGMPFIFQMANYPYNSKFTFPLCSECLLYALIGYYFSKFEIKKFIQHDGIYILGIIGFLTILLGTQYVSLGQGWIDSRFKGYYNLPCILYTSALFLFFKSFSKTIIMDKIYWCCKYFAPHTFAIYLTHQIILNLLTEYTDINFNLLWPRLLFPFLTLFFLSSISWVIKKIPYVNKILP